MYTLGINAAFHDSAASLVKDGELIAAAEEERFMHVKHAKRPVPFSAYELPYHAIDYCLKEAGIHLKEVDHISYSFDPAMNRIQVYPGLDDLYLASIRRAPNLLMSGYPLHLQKRFDGTTTSDFEWHFVDHHTAHAASRLLHRIK